MNSKMKIAEHKIPVREVFDGYVDSAELGVRGYGGKLTYAPHSSVSSFTSPRSATR